MRPLKYHEQKLLKKTNFQHYRRENQKDVVNIGKFGLKGKEEYSQYTKLVLQYKKVLNEISDLDDKDPVKQKLLNDLADKLYNMGVIDLKQPSELVKVNAASFCRRRAVVMLVKKKFAEHLTQSFGLLSHGHIRIGPEVIQDPALIITRKSEDLLTWVNGSMKKKVQEYNGILDDYDLNN
ncbi:hypothetical protein DICPUDRAFT_34708 [Dictyostelium purpureum]|uniref:Small ribosomal subunit protein uS4 N-terminal domain-containing protein n=1 Tax=Dictyostelium purpureum TaxID=5786 RepID=F0ZN46_DICPU|nr:uncharacterized protein DICPUDRAFT_34708 [Dictyostelium purpureum]EGC34632.1 hypothetical protein DICPUDRAFT_34708 [Dictyostelium purpureum]|eukprot:XP_003288857.1 hypothetical protein DICPUDRAFT_34708 [Dictyostelium purpureum]